MEERPYGTLDLQGFGVGGMIRLEFDGAGIEGREEGFGKAEFGHCVRDRMRLLGRLCFMSSHRETCGAVGLDDGCQGLDP